MASRVDTTKLERKLKRLADKRRFAAYAAAAFNPKLESGSFERQRQKVAGARPNNPWYLRRKAKRGQSTEAWKATGRTMRALTKAVPEKFSTRGGMKLGFGRQPREHAYLQPVSFGYAGAGRKAKDQWAALGAVDWGSRKTNTPQRRLLYWANGDDRAATPSLEKVMRREARKEGF